MHVTASGRILSGLALLILGVALTGCQSEVIKRRNLICMIDYSASMSDEVVQGYMNVISRSVLANIGEYDRIVFLPIDAASKTRGSKIFYLDMSEKTFSLPTDGFVHAIDSTRRRVLTYAATVGTQVAHEIQRQRTVRRKFSDLSDIAGALEQAAQFIDRSSDLAPTVTLASFFSGHKRVVSQNVIIIFSDMIQESSDFSFASSRGVTPSESERILDRLRSRNAIPDLSGCAIFVYGRTGRSNTQVENIESFWEKYFQVAHGDLRAYDYEPDNVIAAYLSGTQ
jgi:hypothetical protein